ncbi:hypothetical protein PENTCL1PPCAC_8283, partial [Pristionchus entomophagus]
GRVMASDAQKVDGVPAGGDSFGTIRWEIDKDYISTYAHYSSKVEVVGMNWAIMVFKDEDENYVRAFLRSMEDRNKVQGVEVAVKLSLINHKDGSKTVTNKNRWSYGRFWTKDNKITFEIQFALSNFKGSRKIRQVDFTSPNFFVDNIGLLIEGKKIYVSKQLLSIHSPVFHSMFYGNFDEKNKNEVELKDIAINDFIELLNVI